MGGLRLVRGRGGQVLRVAHGKAAPGSDRSGGDFVGSGTGKGQGVANLVVVCGVL